LYVLASENVITAWAWSLLIVENAVLN